MSYVMHNRRVECLNFLKRFLKEKQTVSQEDLKKEIMIRFNFSGYTAERYINDLITMGIAKINRDHVVYIPLKEEKGKGEKKSEE